MAGAVSTPSPGWGAVKKKEKEIEGRMETLDCSFHIAKTGQKLAYRYDFTEWHTGLKKIINFKRERYYII